MFSWSLFFFLIVKLGIKKKSVLCFNSSDGFPGCWGWLELKNLADACSARFRNQPKKMVNQAGIYLLETGSDGCRLVFKGFKQC